MSFDLSDASSIGIRNVMLWAAKNVHSYTYHPKRACTPITRQNNGDHRNPYHYDIGVLGPLQGDRSLGLESIPKKTDTGAPCLSVCCACLLALGPSTQHQAIRIHSISARLPGTASKLIRRRRLR